MSNLQALHYTRGSLSVLDQLKIPHETTWVQVVNVQDTWNVIRLMQVRGAPLIAITAALGLAVEVHNRRIEFATVDEASSFLLSSMDYLRTSRPTAVNLFIAMDNLTALVNELKSADGVTSSALIEAFVLAAEKIYSDDITANRTMGMHGAKRILDLVNRKKVRVLTICNTGSLATGGYGTALGVVRSLHELGRLEHVYACETRPYNQGARLTAYEIVKDNLPGTLICDSMASALMAVKGVDCVIVGADRIAANGDTANKIGTYQLAIAAKYHNVPFFTAAPTTTLDVTMASGAEIEIEERPASELTTIFNQRIAPEGIAAWNPAFDVTPCALIRGIITEVGVIETDARQTDGLIPVADFLRARAAAGAVAASNLVQKCSHSVAPVPTPTKYARLDQQGIVDYILQVPKLTALLGVADSTATEEARAALKINEVGDGNLNFVYIIEGPRGNKIVVKQALPYVRCVGESWPLTLRRAYFEYSALVAERRLTGGEYVPEVYHFDELYALIGELH
jgi:5-methylthioribose kinase